MMNYVFLIIPLVAYQYGNHQQMLHKIRLLHELVEFLIRLGTPSLTVGQSIVRDMNIFVLINPWVSFHTLKMSTVVR